MSLRSAAIVVVAAAIAGAGAAPVRQAGTPAPRSVRDGVFTEAQARRGLIAYTQSCEHCHGSDLTGRAVDEIPALVADAFVFHWAGRTVHDVYDRIRTSMPADAPGTLTEPTYVDIVAYLLEANGYPRGAQELERDELRGMIIDRPAGGARGR